MKLTKETPEHPNEHLLLPQNASAEIKREVADFAEDLRRKEARCLGFIPAIAYEDAINRGRLFVCLNNDEPIGFTLWGQRRKTIRIYQHAIVEDARRARNATRLLVSILNTPTTKNAKDLRLRVADDLQANGFWRAVGCDLTGTQPGGKTWGRTINLYRLKISDKMALASAFVDVNLADHARSVANPLETR